MNCEKKENWNKRVCKKAVGEAHFTIIFPKADNSNNKIKPSEFFPYIDKINNRFGGSTTKPITLGCWEDKERKSLQCESGFAVETWRDFDVDSKLIKKDASERKKILKKDYNFMKKLARESARDFGQDSVPVVFDNVSDVSLNKGVWVKKLNKNKITGKKIRGDLWKKYI